MSSLPSYLMPDVRSLWAYGTPEFIAFPILPCAYIPFCSAESL